MSPALRDRQTVCGVRLNPAHGAGTTVHAFKAFTGDTTLETQCGVAADFEDGARQTTDLISCLGCAESSFQATQRWVRSIRWSVPRG